MKLLFIRMTAILLGTGLLLAILFASSKLPNRTSNGFIRHWLPYQPLFLQAKKLDDEIIQLCGVSNDLIYLAGSNPTHILVLEKNLSVYDTLTLHISLPEEKLIPGSVQVYQGNLYLHTHNSKWVIQGNLESKKLRRTPLQTEVFTKSIQFCDQSLYIRNIDPRSGKPVFQKINAATGEVIHQTPTGDHSPDFGIGSDGMFTYDEIDNKIFFVRYLTNNITVLDTNLVITAQGHTIDTVFSNDVKIYQTSMGPGQHNIAPSTSRVPVNRYAFTRNKKLYIVSELKADNESYATFRSNHIIDVYRCDNLDYLGSFAIPKRKRSPVKSARFSGDTLFVLYEGAIASYKLPD